MKKTAFLLLTFLFSFPAALAASEGFLEIIQNRASALAKWEVARLPLMAGDVIYINPSNNGWVYAVGPTGTADFFNSWGGRIIDCLWTTTIPGCIIGVQNKTGIGTPNASNNSTIECSTSGSYANSLTLTAMDNDGGSSSDGAVVLINSQAKPSLRITAFSAEPLQLTSGDNFTSVSVKVKNVEAGSITPGVKVEVLDPLSAEPIAGATDLTKSCGSLAYGKECTLDFSELDISALPVGAYTLIASAFDQTTGQLHHTEELYFSVTRPVSIPELNELLLPLIAFSVLAVLFFAGRRG